MTATNPLVRSVTACFPCYNDAATIATMVTDARAALAPLVETLEIVVVDDGSADGSWEVLTALAAEVPELRPIRHERNRGYGGALLSAFGAATQEWIFYTDGDAQYDAREASAFVLAVRPGVDVVQGWKVGRGDPWYRKVIGRGYHHVVKLLFRLPVRDTDCDFRLFRRELVHRAGLRSQTGVICVEMMRRFTEQGAVFVERPVSHYERPHGRSQFFRFGHVARAARQLAALWWRLMAQPRLARSRR
jgi:glycosyltransferase involved in cell wall biosynthesis